MIYMEFKVYIRYTLGPSQKPNPGYCVLYKFYFGIYGVVCIILAYKLRRILRYNLPTQFMHVYTYIFYEL